MNGYELLAIALEIFGKAAIDLSRAIRNQTRPITHADLGVSPEALPPALRSTKITIENAHLIAKYAKPEWEPCDFHELKAGDWVAYRRGDSQNARIYRAKLLSVRPLMIESPFSQKPQSVKASRILGKWLRF